MEGPPQQRGHCGRGNHRAGAADAFAARRAWAILTLQDRTGVIEALVFPEAFQKLEPILKAATPLLVKGRVAVEDVGTRVIVSDARLLDQVADPSAEPACACGWI